MYSFSYLEPVYCFMSNSNCCFLTCIYVSQKAGQVVWYSYLFQNFPQFIVIHTVKGFGIVNKAETDVFLQLSCFFNDPADVGNLISGFSAFSKTSSNICDGPQRMAERSYPTPKVRSSDWVRQAVKVQEWPRGAIPHARSGAAAERSNPTSKERWLHGCRRAERSYYFMFKVRRGGCEEIPLVQDNEQWLCFAGEAVKRYPTSKVRETQVRW